MSVRIFGHYISLPLLLLIVGEALLFIAAVYFAAAARFLEVGFPLQSPSGSAPWLFPRAALYALVLSGVMVSFGLYSSALYKGGREYRVRFLASFPVAALAMAIIFYVIQEQFIGRIVLALSLVFSLLGAAFIRAIFFRIVGHKALKRRVLVLGSGSRAAEVMVLLDALGAEAGCTLVGFVRCEDEQPQVEAAKLVGDCRALRALVNKHFVNEIVVGVRERRGHLSMSDLLQCKLEGVSVVDLPTFFERETGCVQLNSLSTSWMVYSEGFARSGTQKVLKRAFDIWISAGMLVIALPLMLLAALAIWIGTGGPILYRQKRIGEVGRVFEILKFRTMRVDAEQDGIAQWAHRKDHRITRVGKFLRVTRIDELPQLVNVLRGEMSFVGPRPERPTFVSELSEKVPYYASRHSVKPGITGWAQVRCPYGSSVDDSVRKLQFDLYYVKNHSLFLDLLILVQTAHVVLFGGGAR